MNTSNINKYAPQARIAFISAVTERANQLGITEKEIEPATVVGDLMQVAGSSFAASQSQARQQLVRQVQQRGFAVMMEQVAYTWFNRFCAIRYMELHGYLDHGYRVLSHPEKIDGLEILDHAQDAASDLGLDRNRIIELKLAGNKDEQLYRELLLGQCHKLHQAMPFLFEAIDGATELLIPDNLTRTDSLIRGMVKDIPEADWQEIEIIGWLYQFYISGKKDQVIGKVVKSEDIPAATQLFTPNWIVKYMVQNSLGRKWLLTYPDSPLTEKMEYYIGPGEQTAAVEATLAAINPDSIDPEELTLLDPACGSGHILVEAYDLLKEIYLERGYRSRDIPRLILEKNLYGLDIDERAAQMTGFALLMKGRADDRRLLNASPLLNVMALRDSVDGLAMSDGATKAAVDELVALFEDASTFGSLLQVPESLAARLPQLRELCEQESGDLFVADALNRLRPLVRQAQVLAMKLDTVVANPPYMGGKGMNSALKSFAKTNFPDSKSDLFAMFIERNLDLAKQDGVVAMITMQSWMFLSSYEKLREKILDESTILSMAHLGARGFDSIGGEVVQTTAFTLANAHYPEYKGAFVRLVDGKSEAKKAQMFKRAIQ